MRCVALLLIECLLSSCATIRLGHDEVIAVDSNPSGASTTIKCAGNVSVSGTTPARLTIPRKAEECRVSVEKSGLRPQNVPLERGFNSAYWMNFLPASGFPLAFIAAFSDGVERLALRFPARVPVPGFFNPLFELVSSATANEAEAELTRFLHSPRIRQRSDDDCTVAVGVREVTKSSI